MSDQIHLAAYRFKGSDGSDAVPRSRNHCNSHSEGVVSWAHLHGREVRTWNVLVLALPHSRGVCVCVLDNSATHEQVEVGNCCVKKFTDLPSDYMFAAVKRVFWRQLRRCMCLRNDFKNSSHHHRGAIIWPQHRRWTLDTMLWPLQRSNSHVWMPRVQPHVDAFDI